MSATTHVINPLTGRQIKIGGAMYKKLLREGVLVNQEPAVATEEVEVAQATKLKKKKKKVKFDEKHEARQRKKMAVLKRRASLREQKKLQKALEKEKKKKQKMLRKQEEKLKRQREAFEAKQRIARETDFRRQMTLAAKERERQMKHELNKQAKKKASGVFSKMLLEHLEELIESENLEGTIETLLDDNFNLSEPQVAQITNVLVEKTEEVALRVPEGLKSELQGEEGATEEVDELTPSEEDSESEEEDSSETEGEEEEEEEEEEEVEEVEEEHEEEDNFL